MSVVDFASWENFFKCLVSKFLLGLKGFGSAWAGVVDPGEDLPGQRAGASPWALLVLPVKLLSTCELANPKKMLFLRAFPWRKGYRGYTFSSYRQ
jgi:hypothetical protein